MQTHSTEFLQQIINPLTFENDNSSKRYMSVIATSYAFKLSSTDKLIPYHKALSEVSDTLGFYNIGIDEGLPKNKAECIILGKNIVNENIDKQAISFSINEIKKTLNIYPKRSWIKQGDQYVPSCNGHVESIFISYKNAYGGIDHELNPDGMGYYKSTPIDTNELALPFIELAGSAITSPSQKNIIPVSFSIIPMHWRQRAQFYGEINKENHPAIPKNTNPIFFQSTPIDQQRENLFTPREKFSINGMSKNQPIKGQIPNYVARIFIKTGTKFIEHEAVFDTMVFFPNEDIGFATFRAKIPTKTYDAKEIESSIFALDHADIVLQKEIGEYENILDVNDENLLSNIEKTLLPSYFKT